MDARLREFRKVTGRRIQFYPFDSPAGKRLLAQIHKKPMLKFIGVWTRGIMAESSETREAVEREFAQPAKQQDDWFYVIVANGKKFFVADNGEFGYTAMLADEY